MKKQDVIIITSLVGVTLLSLWFVGVLPYQNDIVTCQKIMGSGSGKKLFDDYNCDRFFNYADLEK